MEQTLQYLQQNWLEIFSLVTGLIFLILEIRQKNAMWVVSIFSSFVAAVVFLEEKLYASMALNIYYVVTAVWGLFTWIRDSRKLKTESVAEAGNKDKIHLSKLTWKIVLISIVCFLILTPVIYKILIWLGDTYTSLFEVRKLSKRRKPKPSSASSWRERRWSRSWSRRAVCSRVRQVF